MTLNPPALTVTDESGAVVFTGTTHRNWNGALRASERFASEVARARGVILAGGRVVLVGKPGRVGSTYARSWTSPTGVRLDVLVSM